MLFKKEIKVFQWQNEYKQKKVNLNFKTIILFSIFILWEKGVGREFVLF